MSRKRKQPRSLNSASNHSKQKELLARHQADYQEAMRLAQEGHEEQARAICERLEQQVSEPRLRALVLNDLGAMLARAGDATGARRKIEAALALDPQCRPARANLSVLDEACPLPPALEAPENSLARTTGIATLSTNDPPRIAILSFLFNWPSTGGGTVHTYELARFLADAGFRVRHIYARFPAWELGNVQGKLPYDSEVLAFSEGDWNPPEIQARYRAAVAAFAPDHVIVTDSWNMKPLLAEAVSGYPYILRFQAMECLCPLNNVRLLPGTEGRFRQCPNHQLARPEVCVRCVSELGQQSGSLHRAERDLSGFGTPAYHELLLRALANAEAVLVVNPLHEVMLGPYARQVRVVTSGMDPARFPNPWPDDPASRPRSARVVFFAGLVQEMIKGFDVLHEACARLWKHRQDFELVATGEPAVRVDAFTRFVGWQSQPDLPRHLRASDIVAVPTIAQDALGRTAAEAMAAGRPVVASRLGGLPFTVIDGATGLLCEPNDPEDLASKIAILLDDPDLRERMGSAGRRRFDEHYSWQVIIDRHYRPLLTKGPRPLHSGAGIPAISRESVPSNGQSPYVPFIPAWVDLGKLTDEVSEFFGLERPLVETKLAAYRTLHESKRHAERLGERKTLCFEEAFIVYVLLDALRPRSIVELGTQNGRSARRLLDIRDFLGLEAKVVTFDVSNQVEHFAPVEAELVTADVSGVFRQKVLKSYRPGLIFSDVHPYGLLKEILQETMRDRGRRVLVVHDCGPGLCNPRMAISHDDPNLSSSTGVWERHILAELFEVDDPLSPRLNHAESKTSRLRIFTTPHGLGVILPKNLNLAKHNRKKVNRSRV
jgi:glycosyltransferase involved in cell wall biosynthesis